MILDLLSHAAQYRAISPGIAAALQFLAQPQSRSLPIGRHAVDGERIVAIVDEYLPRARNEAFWESHRRYIDVQYVVSGGEMMGWAPLSSTREKSPYDESRDLLVLGDPPPQHVCWLPVHAGMFAIFSPEDAHMPGLAMDSVAAARVRKIVMKVRTGD